MDRDDYSKAKDYQERKQLELKWRSKGYTTAKIRNIAQAAEANRKLDKQ